MRQFVVQSAIWAFLCFVSEAICRFVLRLGYPYNYPGIQPVNFFADFRFLRLRFLHFHSRDFFNVADPMNYPPPLLVVYKFFMLKPLLSHPAFATLRFASFLLLVSWVVLWLYRKALVERGLSLRQATLFLLATYAFSFAYWFEFQQSNMEIIVWMMVCGGVWAYWTKRPWTACVFFGLAAAMKIFPLVFLGLFVARKQYKQVLGALVVIAITTVVTLWIVCPDLPYAAQHILAGLTSFGRSQSMQMLQVALGFDHSLFALVKRVIGVISPSFPLDNALKYYMLTVALGGIVLFFARIRNLPLVNQVICLCVAAILLPPTSYDYTLLHLYPAFALLVFCAMERETNGTSTRGLYAAFGLLAFLLSPQSEFIVHGIRFSAQLKAVALVLFGLVGLAVPFPMRRDDLLNETGSA
jgi:hypothetical protein